ncbi:MAG: hypothetical protein SGJ02_08630 [bacterium]|nr:hypothetical protein [bacterium]
MDWLKELGSHDHKRIIEVLRRIHFELMRKEAKDTELDSLLKKGELDDLILQLITNQRFGVWQILEEIIVEVPKLRALVASKDRILFRGDVSLLSEDEFTVLLRRYWQKKTDAESQLLSVLVSNGNSLGAVIGSEE